LQHLAAQDLYNDKKGAEYARDCLRQTKGNGLFF
jgi:hypothetical protein